MASHRSCQCHQHQHQHQHEHEYQAHHHHHHQSTCCCTSPQQPQLSPSDPLLQAIASQLLHQQQNHLFSTQYPQQPRHYHQPTTHHHQQQQEKKPQSQSQDLLYTSLLRRITALESSLHQLSSSSSSSSLKDHAARTIQAHFRAHLVRRSQTLRNLKHLAIIKTTFTSLKSSLSDKPHFNPDLLSRKAMDLLHKLDFIQGGDPMIRDGKRSMSRELVQFLEYIDVVSIKRRQLHSKASKSVKFVERSRVYRTPQKQFSGEDAGGSSDDQTQVLENLRRKIENIEGFTRAHEEEDESQVESEAPSSGASDGDRNPKGNHGYTSHSQGQNGKSMFCPPLPVQMESMHER